MYGSNIQFHIYVDTWLLFHSYIYQFRSLQIFNIFPWYLLAECPSYDDMVTPTLGRWPVPLVKMGEKKYYIGTFFKVRWSKQTAHNDTWLWNLIWWPQWLRRCAGWSRGSWPLSYPSKSPSSTDNYYDFWSKKSRWGLVELSLVSLSIWHWNIISSKPL